MQVSNTNNIGFKALKFRTDGKSVLRGLPIPKGVILDYGNDNNSEAVATAMLRNRNVNYSNLQPNAEVKKMSSVELLDFDTHFAG